MKTVRLQVAGPYDLPLCLKALASFSPVPPEDLKRLRIPVMLPGNPVILKVRQVSKTPAVLEVSATGSDITKRLRETVEWILLADVDLLPFYRMVERDPLFAPLTKQLRGLKPMRPVSLFEMVVIAITEQQISLIAAHRIRFRVVERFGEKIDGFWLFPTPEILARASLKELGACGLSRRKSEYIRDLAGQVADGTLDLERLKFLSDDEVRSVVVALCGFGRWSAEYILIRGLGRPDVVPADDLGIRSLVGKYLGDGSRMTAEEVRRALEPYAPFRGMAMFYLMVHHRLARGHAGR